MAKFNADDKKEIAQGGAGFYEEGVYPVQIVDVTAGVTDKGSEFFEFEVTDDQEREGKVRTYFTDAAKQYSFNTIRNIFVHNTVEDNKDKVRAMVDEVEDTEALLKLCEGLRGKSCWLLVQKTGDTYTNPTSGKTYDNVNRNLYGYEPKFTPSTPSANPQNNTAKQVMGGGEEITKDNVDEVFPFGS